MSDYPKWVPLHTSHVYKSAESQPVGFFTANHIVDHSIKSGPVIAVHDFDHFSVARDGSVSVLVDNAADEARAKNPKE